MRLAAKHLIPAEASKDPHIGDYKPEKHARRKIRPTMPPIFTMGYWARPLGQTIGITLGGGVGMAVGAGGPGPRAHGPPWAHESMCPWALGPMSPCSCQPALCSSMHLSGVGHACLFRCRASWCMSCIRSTRSKHTQALLNHETLQEHITMSHWPHDTLDTCLGQTPQRNKRPRAEAPNKGPRVHGPRSPRPSAERLTQGSLLGLASGH